MAVEIHTLGGFELVLDGRATDELKNRPTCSAVLAYVAVEHKVTRDSVLAVLWPEWSETRARHALSQTLYQLRKNLGPERLLTRGQELRLADGIGVDVAAFEHALRERRFVEAVELYGGRFLHGWAFRGTAAFHHWLDGQAERLARLHRTACRGGIAASVDAGDREGARALAERWVDVEPDGSEAHRQLIRLLVEDGEREGALERYAALEKRLAESGMVPGPEILEVVAAARPSRRSLPSGIAPRHETPHQRIVVLPFAHAGPPRLSHLTYGLGDETTRWLSRHPGLAVVARSSAFAFLGSPRSLLEIGNELKVDHVLEGTVRWNAAASPATAVVSPQLVRVRDGKQLWAAQWETDIEGVGNFHVRLADRTLSALGLTAPSSPVEAEGSDPRGASAHELYVRGLQHWHQRSPSGLEAAIDLFLQVIELHPFHARAYAGLALAYAMMPSFLGETPGTWMPRAKHAAERALELDLDVPEGHLAMGVIAWNRDLDAASAGRHWDRTLELEPSNTQAMLWHAYRSAALRRPDEARRRVIEALALDPLSLSTNFDAGLVRWHLRDREQALEQMRRVLQMDPSFVPAAFTLGAHHMTCGEIDDARREWSRIRMFGPSWQTLLEKLDDPPSAVAVVDRIVEISPLPVNWYAVAQLYVVLGAPERATFWMGVHLRNVRGEDAAYPTGGPSLFHAACEPTFDSLRSDPRFQALIRALKLDPAAD